MKFSLSAATLQALSICYLFIPILIFLAGWLIPVVGIPILIGVVAVLYFFIRDLRYDSDRFAFSWIQIIAIIAVALAWATLAGAGGIGFQNADYTKHNAIFRDLIAFPWPVYYPNCGFGIPSPEQPCFLVYYIAYYLPPAIFGKLAGWQAANLFMFAWTFLGCALALFWFAKHTRARPILAALIFVFLSGLDLIGKAYFSGALPQLGDHIEWWAGYLQYSANTTLLFWVPQHAIPSWIFTGLVMNEIMYHQRFKNLLFMLGGTILWSPFLSVGLLPFTLLGMRSLRRYFSLPNLVVAPLLLIVTALFILSNVMTVPKGFFLGVNSIDDAAKIFLPFYLLEFGIYAALAFVAVRKIPKEQKPLWWTALACLVLLSFYKLGNYNDFAMRSTIAALFAFWIFVARALLSPQLQPKILRLCLAVFLIAGSFTALSEAARALRNMNTSPPQMVRGVFELDRGQNPNQYVGDPRSFFFSYLARWPANRR